MPGKELVLLLGGAGAGKSTLAQRMALAAAGPTGIVVVVATAQQYDDEMRERVRRHQAARPKHWRLVEEPYDIVQVIERNASGCSAVLLDCLTVWDANLLLRSEDYAAAASPIAAEEQCLRDAWERQDKPWFVVSNEVGMGVVPPYESGRAFRDALGRVNQLVAARTTKALLVVAGLALDLKTLGIPALLQPDDPQPLPSQGRGWGSSARPSAPQAPTASSPMGLSGGVPCHITCHVD
ncbi:MAG: bifunctional adenosylcobinamide kinase/adenosylcobinamide-phosphate guanylyltransferase [Dehalococcoidia bacterium]|nr:bifunctional adenosylcobinamide kinase/adenosylcobinamide-phosphate guanylyltransferase [Dehalococcoidia bacterium]